jgi:hypothetical protein
MDRLDARQQLASWMCGIGLLLGAIGYSGARFIPLTPLEEKEEYELQHDKLPSAEEKVRHFQSEENKEKVRELRRLSIHARKKPPYELPGVISLTIGGLLLGTGMFLWFRDSRAKSASKWTNRNEDV